MGENIFGHLINLCMSPFYCETRLRLAVTIFIHSINQSNKLQLAKIIKLNSTKSGATNKFNTNVRNQKAQARRRQSKEKHIKASEVVNYKCEIYSATLCQKNSTN